MFSSMKIEPSKANNKGRRQLQKTVLGRLLCAFAVFTLLAPSLHAQILRDAEGNTVSSNKNGMSGNNENSWGRDTTSIKSKSIPMGMYMWRINERLGNIIPMENDTMPHKFQNTSITEGMSGQYNHLGNLGSPRMSRLFMDRKESSQFLFLDNFDFFLTRPDEFLFANTKSPITNVSYHECGNKTDGEDRLRAYFASNINKQAGVGFKIDYLYGRGYYSDQSNSMFDGTVYGYYLGDHYNMHAYVSADHLKMAENGGIEDDNYITNPEKFSQSFGPSDIPTVLSSNWNRNNTQTFLLTHRYNLGFHRTIEMPDSLKPKLPTDEELMKEAFPDSLLHTMLTDTVKYRLALDSVKTAKLNEGNKREFVPVTSFIHTLEVKHLTHIYQAYATPEAYYMNHFYGDSLKIKDQSKAWSIKNTVGLALAEGFNKWAKAGLTAFASYEFRNFEIPGGYLNDTTALRNKYKEHNISVGGQLIKTQGSLLHYDVLGEFVLAGEDIGQFSVEGHGDLNFHLFRDTVQLAAHAYIKNLNPSFFYRHYHSQNIWYDNDLDKEFRTRIEGTFSLKRTKTSLTIGVENLKNYTYFAKQLSKNADGKYSQGVAVKQNSDNIQVLSAKLNQNFRLGILNWENELAYQTCSNKDALPLPTFNLYSNLYIKFHIAKVLLVELGGNMAYFTSYYAPDYAPYVQSYCTQASDTKIKIGNYPIVSVYANLHLKHCRFYLMYYHVNQGGGSGQYFLAPHYPINPRILRFGLSWNFFN